ASATVSNGSGNYSYSWSNGIALNNISNLCSGNYTLTVTDNVLGCISFATVTITQPSLIGFGFPSSIDASCLSGCDGTATVYPTGGSLPYAYSWNFSSVTTQTATGLCAGSNIVTVTDANGCVSGQTILIGTQPAFTATAATTNATCGDCDGSATLTVSGGTGPYTYQWSNSGTQATASNLCAGVYSVEITDGNNCSQILNVNISNSGGATGEDIDVTNVTCFGLSDGSAVVNSVIGGTAPYTYLWLPGGQITNSINNVTAGNYSLEITDANGCKRLTNVEILQGDQIVANSIITNSSCTTCNGSVNLITSGGVGPYTYNWSGGQTSSSLTGLCAGLYDVIINDNNGCSELLYIPVSNISGPTASITSTNINCFGACNGTATVTASGGSGTYNYAWTPGSSVSATSTNLCSGTYFVEVQDAASGCITFMSATLTSPTQLALSTPNVIDVTCGGNCDGEATIIAHGGVLPYTYNWGNGINTDLCSGTYPVTVTDDNGCTASQSLSINEPTPISITITNSVDASCSNVNDGSIEISSSGGTGTLSNSWSTGATGNTITNLYPGDYTLTVTDQAGCEKDTIITINPLMQVSALALGDTSYCEGNGPVILSGNGGTTYTWYSLPDSILVSQDSVFTVNPAAGVNVYLLAAQVGQCIAYDSVTVNVFASPIVDAGKDASIIAGTGTPIGGAPTSASGNTYLWSPSEGLDGALIANPFASPLTTTNYNVTVTDQNGCESIDSVLVNV
ncbi:MAG: SprB repeat-containing protein, partial [Bacteroidota bacterium]|nr:SprB repeat-containing protein [Bacteroidota bacterium]